MSDKEDKQLEGKIRKMVRKEFFNLLNTEFKLEFEEEFKRLFYKYMADQNMENELLNDEKNESLRSKEEHTSLSSWLNTVRNRLELYEDSTFENREERPVIILKDGRTIGFGFASHLSGDPGDFKKLGFSSYSDFYANPLAARNKYLRLARDYYDQVVVGDVNDMPLSKLKELRGKLLNKFEVLIKQMNPRNL